MNRGTNIRPRRNPSATTSRSSRPPPTRLLARYRTALRPAPRARGPDRAAARHTGAAVGRAARQRSASARIPRPGANPSRRRPLPARCAGPLRTVPRAHRRRARRRRRDAASTAELDAASGLRIRRAVAAGLIIWMLTGIVLFSHMIRLHPRYVEGFTPAVAAMLGIGVAWVAASRGNVAPGAADRHARGHRLLRRAAAVRAPGDLVDRAVRRARRDRVRAAREAAAPALADARVDHRDRRDAR